MLEFDPMRVSHPEKDAWATLVEKAVRPVPRRCSNSWSSGWPNSCAREDGCSNQREGRRYVL